MSPNTFEGRIQVFGNVLRAAKYGRGRRRLAGGALLGITVLTLLVTLALAVVVHLL